MAQASTGLEAVELFRVHRPDVTILDLHLPGMSGMEVLATMRRIDLETQAIVFTRSNLEGEVFAAFEAGASGRLRRDVTGEELLDVIRSVARGDQCMPLMSPDNFGAHMRRLDLTPREQEVLEMLVKGRSNVEIGRLSLIARSTVKNHISRILRQTRRKWTQSGNHNCSGEWPRTLEIGIAERRTQAIDQTPVRLTDVCLAGAHINLLIIALSAQYCPLK